MKISFVFLFILTILVSSVFAQAPKTKYKITGYTSQKTGKARLLLYTNSNQFIPFDSADIRNGIFVFKGVLKEPASFQLLIGNNGRILFVGNENITVNDRNEKTGAITVTGSKLSLDYDYYFNRWIAPLINRLQAINQKLDSLNATHQTEIDSLTIIQGSLFDGVPDSSAIFIRQKPSSFVSLYLLRNHLNIYNANTITKLFNRLDTSLKQYPSALFIKNKIGTGLQLPAKCPLFSVTDANGQLITLQTFKGTYLLIHFWAEGNQTNARNLSFIQHAADRFQHQNFKVLTVSLNNDTSAWKAAIKKFRLTEHCTNVFLTNGLKNPMALQFEVAFTPRTILVDPDGNIIENNIEGEKVNSRLEKIFSVSVNGVDDVAKLQQKQ